MPPVTLESLLSFLRESPILDKKQSVVLFGRLKNNYSDVRTLAKDLIERGWLTPYQINQLVQGRGAELVLRPYVLLERLGQGGMGQVYKARHPLMNRLVAIKVIRSDRLPTPELVARFRREIQAVARLSHPNIVIAHDAAEVGGKHFLVMEYVEGASLSELVKRWGPLPVSQACAYIRQAALGLQHAFERGLVHRDIKPGNLLVTADGRTVKVLDLGLARLYTETDETIQSLTNTEDVMGTPDYIAPEQTRDFHRADIRADIYSLGCTFYYLLAGQPPFPGGTTIDKFLKHREIEPIPLDAVRKPLPRELVAVHKKMTAKRPEERYQTPVQAAAALEAWSKYSAAETWVVPRTAPSDLIGPGRPETPTECDDARKPSAVPVRQRNQALDPTSAVLPPSQTKTVVSRMLKRRTLLLSFAAGFVLLIGIIWIIVGTGNFSHTPTEFPKNLNRKLVHHNDYDDPNANKPELTEDGECRSGVENGYRLIEMVAGRKFEGHWQGYNPSVWNLAGEIRLWFEDGHVFIGFRFQTDGKEIRQLMLTMYTNGSWDVRREFLKRGANEPFKGITLASGGESVSSFKQRQWIDVKIQAFEELVEINVNGKLLCSFIDEPKSPGFRLDTKPGALIVGISGPHHETPSLKVDRIRIWELTLEP